MGTCSRQLLTVGYSLGSGSAGLGKEKPMPEQLNPRVRVIACTQFLGVPDELLPELPPEAAAAGLENPINIRGERYSVIRAKDQDTGTDAARLIECAGRNCCDSYGVGRGSEDYHKNVKSQFHGSITEHAWLTFYTDQISRGLTHELVRHRIGVAISQRSTRYVDESESPWIWHPLIFAALEWLRENPQPRVPPYTWYVAQMEGAEKTARQAYSSLCALVQDYLTDVRKVDKRTARKQARGAARGALGNALNTAVVWSTNVRNFRNVMDQRASEHADAEIRVWANTAFEAAFSYWEEWLNDYNRVECPDGIGYGLRTEFRKV